MSHRIVTAGTLQPGCLAVNDVAINRRGDRFMTAAAGIFCDLMIELRDLDGVRIASAGEVKGMPESVVRFDRVFSNDVVWRVTVVAGCDRVMARLHPCVVLRLHDVAIGAGGGIVGEIRISLGINECVSSQDNCDAYDDRRQDGDGT